MLGFINSLARMMALLGGLVLSALILLVCISVLGRGGNTFAHWDVIETHMNWLSDFLLSAGIAPVSGDFEILEAGIAFAIFAFLPLCQLKSGHATVDIFTSFLSTRANAWLKAFWEVCMALGIMLITWRLGVGLMDKIHSGETTFLLRFPLWWAFAPSFLAAVAASITAVYCAYARVFEARTGHRLIVTDSGSVH